MWGEGEGYRSYLLKVPTFPYFSEKPSRLKRNYSSEDLSTSTALAAITKAASLTAYSDSSRLAAISLDSSRLTASSNGSQLAANSCRRGTGTKTKLTRKQKILRAASSKWAPGKYLEFKHKNPHFKVN